MCHAAFDPEPTLQACLPAVGRIRGSSLMAVLEAFGRAPSASSAPSIPGGAGWRMAGGPEESVLHRDWLTGSGVFALVVLAHVCVLALALTQLIGIDPPSAKGENGSLRVRLVAARSEAVAALAQPEPRPQPPEPKPQPPRPEPRPVAPPVIERKVVVSEAPATRVVAQAPEVPAPVPETPPPAASVAPAPQVSIPPVTATPAAAGSTSGHPDMLDPDKQAPQEVSQIDCAVPRPDYPRSARRQGLAGQVTVRLVMDSQGRVTSADVIRSSGHAMLDEAARNAALGAACRPYRVAGRAIRVSALQPFDFIPSN
ncbi:MAG: energy transducer TonB [Candidatus Dactylopiibacterium carminicum]|nr:MAG: energy transducer TonB [Candidatus Dactylopiibacterium carminicum]